MRVTSGAAGTPCGPPASHPPGRDRVTTSSAVGAPGVPPSDTSSALSVTATSTATPAGPGPAVAGGDDATIRSPPRSAVGAVHGELSRAAAYTPALTTAASALVAVSASMAPRTDQAGGACVPSACGGRKSLAGASALS